MYRIIFIEMQKIRSQIYVNNQMEMTQITSKKIIQRKYISEKLVWP